MSCVGLGERGWGLVYHDGEVFIVDAVVVDWRFEEVGVLLQPSVGVSWCCANSFKCITSGLTTWGG